MLKQLTPQDIAMDIADQLERGKRHYDQIRWDSCIAGWVRYYYGDKNEPSYDEAARLLRLTNRECSAMFNGAPLGHRPPTRWEAAAMLRNWALTGRIEWRQISREAHVRDRSLDRSRPDISAIYHRVPQPRRRDEDTRVEFDALHDRYILRHADGRREQISRDRAEQVSQAMSERARSLPRRVFEAVWAR